MATRGVRASPEHTRALGTIDLAFFGRRLFGINRQSKSEKAVVDVWKEYHDHLHTRRGDGDQPVWDGKANDLFTNLLFVMSQDLGYRLDRVQLSKGWYRPDAQTELEQEQHAIRKAAVRLLAGDAAIKMEVTRFPFDSAAVAAQTALHERLASAVSDDGTLTVDIRKTEDNVQ
jgi:hypothetical protein